MKQFKVKKSTLSDAQTIHEVNKECLPLYYDIYEIQYMINSKDHLVLIVKNNKQNNIAGYLIANYIDNRCHIMSLGVSEKFRKNGFGTLLVNSLKDYVNGNVQLISLYVHVENDIAIKFYKKIGFEVDKTIEKYYGKLNGYKKQDAYFMVKKLKL